MGDESALLGALQNLLDVCGVEIDQTTFVVLLVFALAVTSCILFLLSGCRHVSAISRPDQQPRKLPCQCLSLYRSAQLSLCLLDASFIRALRALRSATI